MNKKISFVISLAIIIALVFLVSWFSFLYFNGPEVEQWPTVTKVLSTKETKVIFYIPPAKLPVEVKNGECFGGSSAQPYRADAWRCIVGNEISDPCFETAKKDTLICDVNPIKLEPGFQLKLTKALPKSEFPVQVNSAWGWLVELEDGTYCSPFTGTRTMVDGEMADFGCFNSKSPNDNIVLAGDIKTGKTWKVKKVVIEEGSSMPDIKAKSSEMSVIKNIWQ